MKLRLAPSALSLLGLLTACRSAPERPNILFVIWDDVSYPHASAYGSKMVSTPAFNRAPGCSPTRAAFLTGRHIWMIEIDHAGAC